MKYIVQELYCVVGNCLCSELFYTQLMTLMLYNSNAVGLNIICFVLVLHIAQITLTPRHGNMLGGTGVFVTGVCLEPDDRVLCHFDNTPAFGFEIISDSLILCVSPVLNKIGAVSFELVVAKTSIQEFSRVTFESTFYSGKISIS